MSYLSFPRGRIRVPGWIPGVQPQRAFGTNSLSFDGVDDYVRITNHSSLAGTGSHTMEAWVYFPTTPQSGILCTKGSDIGNYGWGMHLGTTATQFAARVVTTSPSIVQYDALANIPSPVTGRWIHVAGVFDNTGKTIKLFIFGVEVASTNTGSTLRHANDSLIGCGPTLGANPFKGILSDVRWWNVTKSAADIQAKMYQRLVGNEANLIAYWPMWEGTGSTIEDITANPNNGTITGATWITNNAPW